MARLRLGVIGLGQRWQRFAPALAALGSEVRVKAVHDPLSTRTAEAARHWRCTAVGGVVDLVERDDLDVILVMDGRLGLWPVERAALANKPVYCTVSPVEDEECTDAVRHRLPPTAKVSVALWPALDLLVGMVEDRILPTIGVAQAIQITCLGGSRCTDPLRSPRVLALLHASGRLLDSAPLAVTAVSPADQPDIVSVLFEFVGGSTVQFMLYQAGIGEPACRLDLQAEHGAVSMALPRRVRWRDGEGCFAHTVPRGTAELASLETFLSAAAEDTRSLSDLQSALNRLDWLRAARRSRDERRRVSLVT